MYNQTRTIVRLSILPAVLCLVTLAACTTPAQRYERAARAAGIARAELQGTHWMHAVYANQSRTRASQPLHVYIEGDGTPWLNNVPAKEPTPRVPMALTLLAKDPAPAVLIGRPCYHGFRNAADAAHCDDQWWTSHRYAADVVASLAHVVQRVRKARDQIDVVLIGYSGGGVLAHLVANELDHVLAVVTVGANLDIDAWTRHHRYLPLDGSLNPATGPSLPNSILQRHLIGADDTVVPGPTRMAFFTHHPVARNVVIDGYSHACCWAEDWPALLNAALQPRSMH